MTSFAIPKREKPKWPGVIAVIVSIGLWIRYDTNPWTCLGVFLALHLAGFLDEVPPAKPERHVPLDGSSVRKGRQWPKVEGTSYQVPEILNIDLDLPPRKRWDNVVRADRVFAEKLRVLVDTLFEGFVQSKLASTFPGRVYGFARNATLRLLLPPVGSLLRSVNRFVCARAGVYDEKSGCLERYFGKEYAEEMRGIADAANLDIGDVAVANAIFEIGGACTSVVAEAEDGRIVHGRTFDYGEQYARSCICQCLFSSKKRDVRYFGSVLLPIVGILDGVRPGVCSVSINTRHTNTRQQPVGANPEKYHNFEGSIGHMLMRNWSYFLQYPTRGFEGNAWYASDEQPQDVTHLMRKVLETASSFGDAVRTLSTAPQGGLSYLAVAGTRKGEGVMITRARKCAADVRSLFDFGNECRRSSLVQTNHDHWLVDPVPLWDGSGGYDRTKAALNALGSDRPGIDLPGKRANAGTTVETMWSVIGSVPNCRPDGRTMIAAVMVPSDGTHEVRWPTGLGTDDAFYWTRENALAGRGRNRSKKTLIEKVKARRRALSKFSSLTPTKDGRGRRARRSKRRSKTPVRG